MDIIDLSNISPEAQHGANVVALGFFDGVHMGHRELLSLTVSEARTIGATPAVFTFRDTDMFKPSASRIMSEEDKIATFAECGIEKIFFADFSAVAGLSPEQFVHEVLIGQCRAKGAVCGFNFRFGKGAAGSSSDLSTLMLSERRFARVLRPVYYGNLPVSSSAIRSALEEGRVEDAGEMLGHPFSMVAPVIHGRAIGHTIGIPTINQFFGPHYVELRHGVYHCECEIGGRKYPGVANFGIRPTVTDGEEDVLANCETHIINFSGDVYGDNVRTYFLRKLRDERKFQNLDELRRQIERDIEEVKRYYV